MPRIRTIKPEFWSSPSMKGLDPWARLLYVAMWNWADDTGRGVANVRELAAFAFPHEDDPLVPTEAELPLLLTEIRGRFQVVFYEVDGRRYYEVPTFDRHQRTERKAQSKYPGPEEGHEYDPMPPDLGVSDAPQSAKEVPSRNVGSAAHANGRSATGTGEQGNRGTGETHSPNGSILFAVPEPAPKTPGYPQAFEDAWVAYGRKGAKKTAFGEWKRAITRATVAVIVAAIPAYVESTPDAKFRKDFERWLKGDCWESAVVARASQAANGHHAYRNPTAPDAYTGELA